MAAQIIAYLGSKVAFRLWLSLSVFFVLCLAIKLYVNREQLTLVHGILFTTDLMHFWLPILMGRYLCRINSDQT